MFTVAGVLLCLAADVAAIGGTVVDAGGAPIAGARVFAELGLGGPVLETRAGDDGRFVFDDMPPGIVGVFAHAPGKAFGGASVNLAVAENVPDLRITLHAPGVVEGRILNHQGQQLEGARVTGVYIKEQNIGIPFNKLRQHGFEEPVSGAGGNFLIPNMPGRATVNLRVAHSAHAQEGVDDVSVGTRNARVQMYSGVVVQGNVATNRGSTSVADTAIVFQRAQPPHDSTVAKTDAQGRFHVRLKPGVYLYWAASQHYRSLGKTRLNVTGERPSETISLAVAGWGSVRGQVVEAGSGRPIAGARLKHIINGNVAGYVRTGPTGEFELHATAGDNYVGLETPPGYLPPADAGYRVRVAEGQQIELPHFILARIPEYSVAVRDSQGNPVAGAAVSVLQPQQVGWRYTNQQGRAALDFASWPRDGAVTGYVEHPAEPSNALFWIARGGNVAAIELEPRAAVSGTVTDARGKLIEGATVAGLAAAPGDGEGRVPLWRVRTDAQGRFNSVRTPAQVVVRCVATAGTPDATGESRSLITTPGGVHDVGRIVVPGGVSSQTVYGKTLKWRELPHQCGPALPNAPANVPAAVMYVTVAEADIALDGLTRLRQALPSEACALVMVVDGEYSNSEAAVPVLRGPSPAAAATYHVNGAGRVVLESFDLPSLLELRSLYQ